MATPIYIFKHSDCDQNFFVIHNTLYDRNETIPMDLTSFLLYHLQTGRSLSGLISIWDDLICSGSSLEGSDFESVFNEECKNKLFRLVEISGALATAERNKLFSDDLMSLMAEIAVTQNNEKFLKSQIIKKGLSLEKPLNYYFGLHKTIEWLDRNDVSFPWEDLEIENNNLSYNVDELNAFIEISKNYKIPLELIPHHFRQNQYFTDLYIEKEQQCLLPGNIDYINASLKLTISEQPLREELIDFFIEAIHSDFGFSEELKSIKNDLGSGFFELSVEELTKVLMDSYVQAIPLINFVNIAGEKVYPCVYSGSVMAENDEFIALSLFGTMDQHVFTKDGHLLLTEGIINVDLMENSMVKIGFEHGLSSHIYQYKENKLILLSDNAGGPGDVTDFSEGILAFGQGYVNTDFLEITPFCFDVLEDFSEGLAAVCLNGKWGYINREGEVVINFQFGAASNFKDGKAIVFVLNEEYQQQKGEWRSVPTNMDSFGQKINEEEFKLKYASYPLEHVIPLGVQREKYSFNSDDLKEEYHCFNMGVNESNHLKYGQFTYIDREGNVIDSSVGLYIKGETKTDTFYENSSIIKTATKDQLDDLSFMKTVLRENLNEVLNISSDNKYYRDLWKDTLLKKLYFIKKLPDDLYLDKLFIIDILKDIPDAFSYLKHFNNDSEICTLAFNQSFHNWNDFSDRMKDQFKVEYEKLLQDSLHQEKESNDETDDLPF